VPARKWELGAYKCECRQGYEYPFGDERTWCFDGATMHDQHAKLLAGLDNMFISNFYSSFIYLSL